MSIEANSIPDLVTGHASNKTNSATVVPTSASIALTTRPVGKPPGTPQTRLKYPITNHGNHDERWGAQIQYQPEYNRYDWYCKKQAVSENVTTGSIAMHYIPSSDNQNDDLHDGITETEMIIPPTLSMDYGEHTSVDIKYPIAKHRLQDETWGAQIESFLLTMLWCSKKQATVVSLLSSLMKSKPVPSLRRIYSFIGWGVTKCSQLYSD